MQTTKHKALINNTELFNFIVHFNFTIIILTTSNNYDVEQNKLKKYIIKLKT